MRSSEHWPRRCGLTALALAAACASRLHPASAPPTLLIHVEHRDRATPLEVWAVPAQGARLRLGLLNAATTSLVRFDRVDPATQYRLVATPRGGAPVTSPPFTPGGADVVAWDLATNTVTPVETVRP